MSTLLETATGSAAQAAERSGVEIRTLTELSDLRSASELFARIWGRGGSQLAVDQLRGIAAAGSYLVGAYDPAGELLGACVGYWGPPDERHLHSHIAGVSPAARGRDLGFALKLHQRAEALQHGVPTVLWTFDPLIARNAHFNLRKLGGRPVRYDVDYYGPMPDELNGTDPTDRLWLHWQLDGPEACAACDDGAAIAGTTDHVPVLLEVGPDGGPRSRSAWVGDHALVCVPPDIEGLRRSAPALAAEWRLAVRQHLGGSLSRGGQVLDFDRRCGGYLLRLGPTP